MVLANVDNIDRYDTMYIFLKSAYDLGIASGKISYTENKSIDEWIEDIY